MKKPKAQKVEAYAAVSHGTIQRLGAERDDVQGLMSDVNFRADAGRIVHLVPSDPAADAVVKAAVRHYKESGSRTHSNDCDVCAAVERYQKRKEKR